jgi:hypothetical protein
MTRHQKHSAFVQILELPFHRPDAGHSGRKRHHTEPQGTTSQNTNTASCDDVGQGCAVPTTSLLVPAAVERKRCD